MWHMILPTLMIDQPFRVIMEPVEAETHCMHRACGHISTVRLNDEPLLEWKFYLRLEKKNSKWESKTLAKGLPHLIHNTIEIGNMPRWLSISAGKPGVDYTHNMRLFAGIWTEWKEFILLSLSLSGLPVFPGIYYMHICTNPFPIGRECRQ
jgi:hypothetical protein